MVEKENVKKPRRRGSERRKEKSRDAARCRRSEEAKIFSDLTEQLPVENAPSGIHPQIDKATVLRVTLGLLKLRKILGNIQTKVVTSKYDSNCMEASDGFLIIVLHNSEVIYVSTNVMVFLGVPQIDFIGQSLYDFTHPCEKLEIQSMLNEKTTVDSFLRMKSTLTSRGRNINLKSALYRVVHCHGSFIALNDSDVMPLVLHCQTLPDFNVLSSRLTMSAPATAFMTQHTMSMKITHCDEGIDMLLGYTESDIINRSFYELYHAMDGEKLAKSFKQLFSMGQVQTEPYRFLSKNGGYAWVVTTASVLYNEVRGEATGVMCVHHMISDIEDDEILSLPQLIPARGLEMPDPILSTESVFCPIADIPEEEIQSKDLFDINAESLVHLAPHAGDTCVPLGFGDIEIEEPTDRPLEAFDISQPQVSSPEDVGPTVTPIQWEPLSIDTESCSSLSPSMSPNYPPSEGFADFTSLSPASSGFPSPVTMEPFNKFSPLFESDDFTDLPMEMRAPYIPMDGDWMLPFTDLPTFDILKKVVPMDPMLMEPSLSPNPIHKSPEPNVNVCTRKHLFVQDDPLDFNTAPQAKVAKTDVLLPKRKEPPKSQVLMNLLTNGEDRNFGYSLEPTTQRRSSLPRLTLDDAEVNAPTVNRNLLTGQQLLEALDAAEYLLG